MLFVLAIFLLIGGFVAVTSNPDTFSPAKFYLAFYLLFHIGVLFTPVRDGTVFLIGVPMLIGIALVIIEAVRGQFAAQIPSARRLHRKRAPDLDYTVPIVIWVLSVPAVFAQLYMLTQLGGLEGYIESINSRVRDWSGYGWARTLINTVSPLNVAFFALGVSRPRSWAWWALFTAHLMTVLGVGFLSGSRSAMLNVFVLLFVAYHYLYRPISMPLAAGMATTLVGMASLLGVVRNGLSFTDGELTTGLSNTTQSFSLNSFTYGVEPLDLIVGMNTLSLAGGSTFLSLVTNAIPRSIYPEKPDTGGVFFTKEYAGDAWEGLSNLTPTFLGEWIINFGYFSGILGYLLVYTLLMGLVVFWYLRLLRNGARAMNSAFCVDFTIFLHVLWASIGLMVGEFTSVILGFVLTQLIPLLGVRILLGRAETQQEARRGGQQVTGWTT